MTRFFYIVFFSLMVFPALAQYQDYIPADSKNDNKRALWLYTAVNGVSWPNEKSKDTITLGVYTGYNNLYNSIVANKKPIKGKPVKIYRFTRYKKIFPTDILFIGSDKLDNIYKINAKFDTLPVLIVTDRFNDLNNTMINIMPFNQDERRIIINSALMRKHGIEPSEKLILTGGTKIEMRGLYEKQKRRLQQQLKEIEKKKREIDSLQRETSKQRNLLIQQKEQINKQKQQLNSLLSQISQKEAQLQKNMEMLRLQELLMKKKQKELALKQKELQEKNQQLQTKNQQIKSKQEELKTLEEKIKQAHKKIVRANKQIQTQRGYILFGSLFLLIVLIFTFIILRAYRINKKINEELKVKNAKILKQKEQIEQQAKLLEATNKELEKLSIVAENAQNGILIMDKEGNIEWLNAGFTKMYGYTLQLFINELDRNIIKASQNPKIKEYYTKCITEKVNVTYETEGKRRDGTSLWVKTTLTPILDENGEITRLVAIDTDITEIKQAEQEIRRQHQMIKKQAEELQKANIELKKLSIVAQEIDNAIIITDAEGNYEWVNPAFERIFGYTLKDLLRTKPNLIKFTRKKEVKDAIKRALETKQSVNYQFKTTNKQGEEIWIQATITPLLNENGEIEKLIVLDSDITAIKRYEREILDKNHELEAQKEKIELQNKQIQASIKYAQTIQQTILPPLDYISQFFNQSLIFLPKDIVSGDFYWFLHIPEENICYAAAVDCTGHGVPGAFMSIISSRILNEIIVQKGKRDPAEILENTDQTIKEALRQETTANRDGLDIVLVKIYLNTQETQNGIKSYTIEYAGAKRPLIYYKKSENKLYKLNATRRSIGGIFSKVNKPFTTQTIILHSNDILYLSTDGYTDQNDQNRKRFGSERFNKLLENIKHKPIEEQKEILLQTLKEFMQNTPQRDDITVWIVQLK